MPDRFANRGMGGREHGRRHRSRCRVRLCPAPGEAPPEDTDQQASDQRNSPPTGLTLVRLRIHVVDWKPKPDPILFRAVTRTALSLDINVPIYDMSPIGLLQRARSGHRAGSAGISPPTRTDQYTEQVERVQAQPHRLKWIRPEIPEPV